VPSRRRLLAGGGLILLAAPALRRASAAEVAEIRMLSDPEGARVGFDPGQTHEVSAVNVQDTVSGERA
jgi:hypothetical protein